MTPDVWTQLQILDCTKNDLCSGGCSEYQMAAWFGIPTTYPVATQGKTSSYLLQFLRGEGDEDDSADLQIYVDSAGAGTSNVVAVQARSTSDSAHFIQAVVQSPVIAGNGPFVVAFTKTALWPADPSLLSWGAPGQTVQLGIANGDQSLAIIDLGMFFPANLTATFVDCMQNGTLSPNDAWVIWTEVNIFMGIEAMLT